MLTLAGVTKRFGDTVAVDNASVEFARGRVHAVLGENGAGKTTLLRMAFGLSAPDSGQVTVDERHITTAADAIASGVGMVHQHFSHVGAMTVAENVALGGAGRFSRAAAEERVADVARRTGLALDPTAIADSLTVGAQQRLEIVKALARSARYLILDEPTAVLAPSEAKDLLRWLREFANGDNAVVLITHKLREALAIADDVTVLRHGRIVLQRPAAELTVETLTTAMLGADAGQQPTTPPFVATPTEASLVAELRAVSVPGSFGSSGVHDAWLAIRAGEILGIAAVEGAGARELLRLLSARFAPSSGVAILPDTIGFVPEDRHRDALVLDFSATENVALRHAGARRGRMNWRGLRDRVHRLIEHYDVRGAAPNTRVRGLSGGNQQKLVLARELESSPQLLVAENPTRGLDIRATQAVHDRLRSAAAGGAAVVIYSSDLDEVLFLATRVIAVHSGHVRETDLDRDAAGRAMLGLS